MKDKRDTNKKKSKTNSKSKKRVIAIGIDAATFSLLDLWMADGKLPNIKELCETGVSCKLRSTIPPWTMPAWNSFATGKNPGKHGAFDFFKIKNHSLVPTSSSDIRTERIWNVLSSLNKKVIVINAPGTYPPKPVDGFLISGMMTPSTEVDFTYPKDLKEKLLERGYKIGVALKPGRRANVARALTFIKGKKQWEKSKIFDDVARRRAETAFWLMDQIDWNFLFILFEGSDRLEHHFWSDEGMPILLRHFQLLDELVGKFKEKGGDNTVTVILSDHGMHKIKKIVYLNSMLQDIDLFYSKKTEGFRSKTLELGRKGIFYLTKLHIPVERMLQSDSTLKMVINLMTPIPDFDKTKAYFPNLTCRGIKINLQNNSADNENKKEEYNRIRNVIMDKIDNLTDPDSGIKVLKSYRREDVFEGPYVNEAPDIIITANDGYTFSTILQPLTEDFRKNGYMMETTIGDGKGDHAMDGILIINGPGIKKRTTLKNVHILDVSPTIYHIMDVPISSDVDGKVLYGAFEPESEYTKRKVNYLNKDKMEKKELSKNEKETIEKLKVILPK